MSDSDDGGADGRPAAAAAAAAPRPPPPPPKGAATKPAKQTVVEENADLPALFWDTMPGDAEEHPDFLALQALAEESTPEERAENFKVQGNNKVKMGLAAKNRHVLREAVDLYGKGVAVRCADADVNGSLLSNRAHVQLLLGNWRHALRDAEAAAGLRPADPKPRHRACRAALEAGELARAAALLRGCGLGVERGAAGEGEEEEEEEAAAQGGVVSATATAAAAAAAAAAGGRAKPDPKSKGKSKSSAKTKTQAPPPPPALAPLAPLPPLPPLDDATRADFDRLARRLLDRRLVLRRERERDRLARERALKPARELARAVLGRGLRLAAPAVSRVGSKSARPRLCPETGRLRWPVVFMYPEAPHAPDVVEDAGEDDLIADHLDVMFADDNPPLEWEREAAAAAAKAAAAAGGGGAGPTAASRYTRSRVELYYLQGAGRPLVGDGAPLDEQEEALAHALHWGWPEEEEEEEGEGGGQKDEEEDGDGDGDGDEEGPGALARREGAAKSGQRGASAAPRFARLDAEALTIGEALRLPGHVVAGVPVFWVVARGTEYHARWLREAPIIAHV